MRILDKYILSKYFKTFIFTVLLLLPIAIAIDISEKIHKFIKHEDLSVWTIAKDYYLNFSIYYINTFMPLALFIAVILFTSKMAANTEIIAMNSGGVSFPRFVRPYFIGATIVFLFSFYANHFIVPESNKIWEKFHRDYLTHRSKIKHQVDNVNFQLNEVGDIIYMKNFNLKNNKGNFFSYEHFEGTKLKYKLISRKIAFNKKDSTYTLNNYKKRYIVNGNDVIEKGKKMDTIFDFKPSDLQFVDYLAKEMNSVKLYKHIQKSEKRGIKNLNSYRVELYKRSSMPTSVFALTIIAVSLAFRKKRGGMGVNLAIGVALMFFYVFFMKIFEVFGASATANSLLLVWLPNIIFGTLAIFLYFNAKR